MHIPPLNLEDPYRHIRPHLHGLKCFPYVGDGLKPEPVTCFVPPTTAERLNVRPCCLCPSVVCDNASKGGRCTLKPCHRGIR